MSVEVPEGQQLFLAVAPSAEMFGAHTSRVPGVMTLTDATVRVPLLAGAGAPVQVAAPAGDGASDGTAATRAAATRSLAATGLDAGPGAGLVLVVAALGAAVAPPAGRHGLTVLHDPARACTRRGRVLTLT